MQHHPRWMPRKVYQISPIIRAKKARITVKREKLDNLTDEMLFKIKILITYGKSLSELSKLFQVNESEIRIRLRLEK